MAIDYSSSFTVGGCTGMGVFSPELREGRMRGWRRSDINGVAESFDHSGYEDL
jgi:hypothetical protein